jgi:hypothetical protein
MTRSTHLHVDESSTRPAELGLSCLLKAQILPLLREPKAALIQDDSPDAPWIRCAGRFPFHRTKSEFPDHSPSASSFTGSGALP